MPRVATLVGGRVDRAVRQRVSTVRARQEGARQIADAEREASALAFAGGYLVSRGAATLPPEVFGWPVQQLAGHDYRLGPRTVLTASRLPAGGALVLLGQPVDVATGATRPLDIAEQLASLESTDAVVRAAGELGGRWTLLVHEQDGRLSVLTDALASQQVWWVADGSVIASHASLTPGAAALPADSLLEVSDAGASVRAHGLGAEAVPSTDPEGTLALIRERLAAHTALLAQQGWPALALTGGPASAAALAAYLPARREGGFAFTHFAPESAREGLDEAQDMFTASRLAFEVGIEHRVLRAQEPPHDHPLAIALRRTFPGVTSLAGAFARAGLPDGVVELHSAGADGDVVPAVDGGGDAVSGMGANDYRLGDLTHPVLLPFNDRHLHALIASLPPQLRESGAWLRHLRAELPELD